MWLTEEIGSLESVQPLPQLLKAVVEDTSAPVHGAQNVAGFEVGVLRRCQLPLQPCQPLRGPADLPPAREGGDNPTI